MKTKEEILEIEYNKFIERSILKSIYPNEFPLAYKEIVYSGMEAYATQLKTVLGEAKQVLNDLWEYMDDRSDIEDGDYGIPKPNKEMKLLVEIDALLEKLNQLKND